MTDPGTPDPYNVDAAAGEAAESRYELSEQGGAIVITLLEPELLHPHEIERLSADLQTYLKTKYGPKVVFDLHHVEALSSAALGMFLSLRSGIESTGGKIRLANVRGDLQEVFKITKLTKVFGITDSVDEAIESF